MRAVAEKLKALGHTIMSDWIYGESEEIEFKKISKREQARHDLLCIKLSDVLVYFSSCKRGRGGKDVEFGYALGSGIHIYIVGSHRHIFHTLADHSLINTSQLMKYLKP